MMHLLAAQIINYVLEMSLTSGGRTKTIAVCSDQMQLIGIHDSSLCCSSELTSISGLILSVFNGIKRSIIPLGKPEISLY